MFTFSQKQDPWCWRLSLAHGDCGVLLAICVCCLDLLRSEAANIVRSVFWCSIGRACEDTVLKAISDDVCKLWDRKRSCVEWWALSFWGWGMCWLRFGLATRGTCDGVLAIWTFVQRGRSFISCIEWKHRLHWSLTIDLIGHFFVSCLIKSSLCT